MTKTKTLLGYPDIKSLLAESDKRVHEYILNDQDNNLLHSLYETFSLILLITETAAANQEKAAGMGDIFTKQKAIHEAERLIDINIAFEDRLSTLEQKYLQARNIRIRCVV